MNFLRTWLPFCAMYNNHVSKQGKEGNRMEFTVQDKKIRIYGEMRINAPVIYLNTVHGEGKAVWDQCKCLDCSRYMQLTIQMCLLES